MRIVCTSHARLRLLERFGVDWSDELEEDISQQILDSAGPITMSDATPGLRPESTSHWRVKLDGMSAVLVITAHGVITTVLPNLKLHGRPKAQKRRKQKKVFREGKRPRESF